MLESRVGIWLAACEKEMCRLILETTLFNFSMNNLDDGIQCTFNKSVDYTKLAGVHNTIN